MDDKIDTEVIVMKRLLKLAAVDALQSLFPVLLWILMPLFLGDSMWAEGYIVTYPYQFIGLMFCNILFKSQMKLDMDEHGKPGDRAKTGIILYVILWAFVVVVSFMEWDFVKLLFGLDEKYRELFCFSLLSLALSWVLAAVISKKQYEKKNGLPLTCLWWGIEILGCLLLAKSGYSLMYVFLFMGIILLFVVIRETHGLRLSFSACGIRFVTVHLVSNLGMFVVYLFGLRSLCTDTAMLAAYNLMSMCSDTQWDIVESAVDTHVTLSLSDGSYKERKALRDGFLFGVLLLSTVAACILCLSMVPVYRDTIDFRIVWILAATETSWFLADGIANVMEAYMAFKSPSHIQPFLMMFVYVIRASVTMLCPSIWAVSIGMALAELFYIVSTMCLYFVKRRKDTVV